MPEELTQKNNNIAGNMASYLLFPAGQSAFYGVQYLKEAKAVNKTLSEFNKENREVFKNFTAKNLKKDIFSGNVDIAKTYETYRGLRKSVSSLTKQSNATKLPFIETIKNIFKTEESKVTIETYKESKKVLLEEAKNNLKEAKDLIQNGKGIEVASENGKKIIKGLDVAQDATKTLSSLKGFTSTFKGGFLKEMGLKTGWMNWLFTAMGTLPKIQEKVIPAFKEKGVAEGIKESFKVLIQGAADLLGFAAGSTAGRIIGGAVGSIFGPAGTWVGSTIGSIFGCMAIGGTLTKVADKITGADKEENTQNTNTKINTDLTTQTENQPSNIIEIPPKTNSAQTQEVLRRADATLNRIYEQGLASPNTTEEARKQRNSLNISA